MDGKRFLPFIQPGAKNVFQGRRDFTMVMFTVLSKMEPCFACVVGHAYVLKTSESNVTRVNKQNKNKKKNGVRSDSLGPGDHG